MIFNTFRIILFKKKHYLLYVNRNFLCKGLIRYICVNHFTNRMKYLNVAEKNDAAKSIAGLLSHGTSKRREGLSPYNKIYEFETNLFGSKCNMVMTSVSGHLLTLDFVGTYKNWQICNPIALFDAPVMRICPNNYEKVKRTLEREVRGCQGLIIWTDCDREGENIGYEIIEVCTAVKSNLRILRAKFSEITAQSVSRALQQLGEPNKNISDAVEVRKELDLRIGAAFTRFQTLRLQRTFPATLSENLISYGSCQFPTLGFVVERYRAVESFVPEKFWKIKVSHTMNDLTVDFLWERNRLFDEQACRVLHDVCVENPVATVINIKTKPKSKWRPLPLDTVELEKTVSRKLKINAKETMRLAEKLYTQGYISYPRTETNKFPKEMNLNNLVGLQTADARWGGFAQKILDGGGATPRQGNKSDEAHPPIHPTKYTNGLSGDEQRLYEFIVRSFLACCHKDAQGQETTVMADIADEKFTASGLMITERNYLEVYPYDKWSSKEIHVYQTGQRFTPTLLDVVEGLTSAPSLLTEADLIALMEKHGIGTDATHAEHIETIKSRAYVALTNNIYFVPGLLGMGLIEGYDAMGLAVGKPHLRAQLEINLKDICEGRKDPKAVLAEQIHIYKEAYMTLVAEATKIDQALSVRLNQPAEDAPPPTESNECLTVFKCPMCKSDMNLRQRKEGQGFYIGCMSYPQCKNAIWLPSVVASVQVTTETCSECGPSFNKLDFRWKNNSLSHLYPPPYRACVGGCDETFLQYLNINVSSIKPANTRNLNLPVVVNGSQQNINNNNRPRPVQTIPVLLRSSFVTPNLSICSATINSNTVVTSPSSALAPETSETTCSCNKAAILLTVKKQSPNFGRKFYKCSVPRENGGCDFFLWAPDTPQTTLDSSTSDHNGNQNSNENNFGTQMRNTNTQFNNTTNWPQPSRAFTNRMTGSQQDDGTSVMCNCNVPSKKLTVNKPGPNTGRRFFGCGKGMTGCGFFQWAEDASSSNDLNTVQVNTTIRAAGRNTNNTTNNTRAPARRKCTLCRQEGHTRNRCPQNMSS